MTWFLYRRWANERELQEVFENETEFNEAEGRALKNISGITGWASGKAYSADRKIPFDRKPMPKRGFYE